MNDREGAIAHSTGGRAKEARLNVRRRLLFDVFTNAVFDSFVAALNAVSGAGDEFGRAEANDVFLIFKVLAAGDITGFDESADGKLFAALAAAAEEEFSDGYAGRGHAQLGTRAATIAGV